MGKKLPQVTYGSPDQPLILNGIEIECYVLDDGRRVLASASIQDAMGMASGGSMVAGKTRLELFASRGRIAQFLPAEAINRLAKPFVIKTQNGSRRYAVEAELLPQLCQAVATAQSAGLLQTQQLHIAHNCRVMLDALSKVAIIALVDEATGFQAVRENGALQNLLNMYVLPENRPYLKVIPNEFIKEFCRLYGWEYQKTNQMPRVLGKFIRKLIYQPMPNPVLGALDEKNPADEKWQRSKKHHQYLTEEVGLSHFQSQVAGVMAILRAASTKEEFWRLFERSYGRQVQLDFYTLLEEGELI